ncbi:MAG: tRNA pseudouridine(38-40) synthase TruA [Cyanobacteria bacterium P01_F01_bin.150]
MQQSHSHDKDGDGNFHRVALLVQYIGTHYHGWQRQPNHSSVQEEIEGVIEDVLGYSTVLHGAGRTDSGVHAAAQVAHFDAPDHIPAYRWADILSHRLPNDIVVRQSVQVSAGWHARFSAIWRRYRYTIYTAVRPNLFVRPFTWHYYHAQLDEAVMQRSLEPLLGRHHLEAFHRAGSSRSHSWVDVQELSCERNGAFLHIEVQASGFLYGMMRLLTGLLVEVGRGYRTPRSFTEIWQSGDRSRVRYAAPPQGLCLLKVGYDDMPFESSLWYDAQPTYMFSTQVCS